MRPVVSLITLVLAMPACAFSSKLTGPGLASSSGTNGGSPSASSSDAAGSQSVTVPDLHGKTPDQAMAALRSAGFQIDKVEELTSRLCNDETGNVPQHTICEQTPAAGQTTYPRNPVRIVVQHDTHDHGFIGGSEWRRMPDVVGKSVADARAALTRANLDYGKHFEIREGDCAPDTVCDGYPRVGQKLMLQRPGWLAIGKATSTPTP